MNETKNQLKNRIAYILEKQKVLGVAVVALMMILAFVMGLSFAGPEPTEPNLDITETTAPTEASKPTEATKPTEPPTQPTEPPTQPTEPPTQPTEPPTEPPTQPTIPQLADPVEIKNYSVESAYIDVLSINGLTTIDTGKFHASLQSLTKNLDDHKEHKFFKSTAQFDGLYAEAAEIDFAKNYVALVYFAATAEYEPDLAEVLLIEDLPFNGERIFRVHVNVNYDDSHEQFMRTDISKVKYHFLMITIPKTEMALNGVIPKDASVDNIKPPIEPPTQPTEATQPTAPPTQPTEPPTQPTEPELSYYEQVQTYTPISGYSTKVCWGKVLNNEVHGSMPSCKLITSGKVDSSLIYSLAQGWCSTTSTNSECPLSFDELSAQYSDKFFETHFLFVAKIFSDTTPAIDRILVGDPVFFENTMIVVYNVDLAQSGPSDVYYVFIEVPRAYLNDANKYTMMWDKEIESLK